MVAYLATAGPPGDPSDYAFLEANGSKGPTRWDPCEPIRYVVNGDESPPGSLEDLDDAIHEISSVTGIEFQSGGDELRNSDDRPGARSDAQRGEEMGPGPHRVGATRGDRCVR